MPAILPTPRLFVSALLFTALIALFLAAAPTHAASAAEIDREVDRALAAFEEIDGATICGGDVNLDCRVNYRGSSACCKQTCAVA